MERIDERKAFYAAVARAKKEGLKEFNFQGKTFKVFEHEVKKFTEFVNEASGKVTSNRLMKIETDIWNKMKLNSGGDIYSDSLKQKIYADAVRAAIKKAGIEKDIKDASGQIYSELENENYHLLNNLLSLMGYFGPKQKKEYKSYHSQYPNMHLDPLMIESNNDDILDEADKMSMSYRLRGDDMHDIEAKWIQLSKDKSKTRSEIIDTISDELKINWFEISSWLKRNYNT
jgi:hypothetical protein